MQKKKNLPQEAEKNSSEWQKSLKAAEQKEKLKKYGIWVAIIIACVVGLGVLVKLAESGGTTPTNEPQVMNNIPKVSETDVILGDKNAKVTIIEYGDFECPTCAKYNPILNQVLEENQGRVKIVYRYFPLNNVHPNARISAQAAYAANKQGKFSEMKDELFNKQSSWSKIKDPRETFTAYAVGIGLDGDKFTEDMNSDEAKEAILASERKAMGIGIQSTPTFILGNKSIFPQDAQEFRELIDAEYAAMSPAK